MTPPSLSRTFKLSMSDHKAGLYSAEDAAEGSQRGKVALLAHGKILYLG